MPRDNIITLLTLASYEDSFSLTQIVLKSVERQKQHKQHFTYTLLRNFSRFKNIFEWSVLFPVQTLTQRLGCLLPNR